MKVTIPRNAETIPNHKHWQFCVGSGHAHLALRTDYVEQLRFIHDELGIERVRFHGIFCDDMNTMTDMGDMLPFPKSSDFKELNFRACGLAYDNVLSAGMKPFVELGFMPKKLASDPAAKGFIYYRPNFTMPADLEAWKEYLRCFVRYLEHRYGEEEVRSWYFEVWNEPDMGSSFFTGGAEGYLSLYRASAEAIKEVDPAIQVGGPATSASKWVRIFREYCESNHIPLDFLSTHQYPGDPIAGVESSGGPEDEAAESTEGSEFTPEKLAAIGKLLAAVPEKTFLKGLRTLLSDKSETTDIPDDVFLNNARIVRQQAVGYPLFYTEWNGNAIFSAETNDTKKAAAYLVKTALDVAPYMEGSSVWCFSDLFEEWHQFVEPFHGGFGLLSQDGIPKPGFWALKFLALCGKERYVLPETEGETRAAAFRSEDGTQILLYRQKMKNDPSAPKDAVTLEIPTESAPKSVTIMRIDDAHGNPLRVWLEDYQARYDLNRSEVSEIIEKSRVLPEACSYRLEAGVITVDTALAVNDVALLQIKF